MANFFKDNQDLAYYFEKGLDWETLVGITEYGTHDEAAPTDAKEAVEIYRDMAELFGQFVADEVDPVAMKIDEFGAKLVDGEAQMAPEADKIFERIRDLDLHWLNVPRELGGMNSPMVLYFIAAEMFARADVSLMTHHGFHGGMALAMLIFSIREGTTEFEPGTRDIIKTRFGKYIEEICNGDAWGTMCITEPDAGSDMARLRAKGEQDADGNWFVTGQKIFITSGHGKYHFVIARTEEAGDPEDPFAGLGGLSFFLVPAYEDLPDGSRKRLCEVDRIEEKLGHHGSVTASIIFDRSPAHLIGKRGEGFKYMLVLMNNARLGVGFESLGLMESAYRKAKSYAAERPSMGKTIDKHEMIAEYLEGMENDIQAIRALAMKAAVAEETSQKGQIGLDLGLSTADWPREKLEREVARYKKVARRLTPLLKYIASERGVSMARESIQLHGGNGYMQEYGVERLLRDAMVMPIYEGTSQIQALMVVKDTLGGIIKNPQKFVQRLAQARWRSLSARDPLERRVAKLRGLSLDAQQYLVRRTATDKVKSLSHKPITSWPQSFLKDWNPKRDFAHAMLHAERFTRLECHATIAEILLEQAQAHEERRPILELYLERVEPVCRYELDTITTTGDRLIAKLKAEAEQSEQAAAQ
jgi:alkylation response protein AidB-like acyl-CoA dehydrogenase